MDVGLIRNLKEQALAVLVRLNPGSLPDFIIVGAQKSGTSSLFSALASHPQIGSSLRKEVHYFDLRTASHSLSWYKGHFAPAFLRGRDAIVGEASPSYMFFPYCADEIAKACPKARILIVLRDPVSRAVSHYRHNRRLVPHLETESDATAAIFAENARVGSILADLDHALPADRARAARFAYLSRGYYAEQIARFHSAFDPQNVLVLDTEDIAGAPGNGIGDHLCDFLGLSPHPLTFETRNVSKEEQPIDPDLRRLLANHFAPRDDELSTLLGRSLSWTTQVPT